MAEEKKPEGLGSERLEKGMRLAFGLASVGEGESVLDAIERMTGTEHRVHLPDADEGDSPVVRVHGEESEERAADDSRYQIVGEIARGGVGVVFKGRDRDLGRDVAIKVLKKDLTSSPEVIQRFIEEAQIEGQLQHPGIVPVYGLGVQPDGRPYFAMKLVKGETLASILKSRRDAAEGRRKLLTMFEQVCQTVAYAHARRVIHRDLKPANILVGAFGQVQVVDWGFAKVLPRGGVADEVKEAKLEPDVSRIETVRSGPGSSGSMVGSVMGTPAYMPPEQALGQPERVDETSDVFSLGAILTEILTGRPPYTGKDSREVLILASQVKTEEAFERLDGCGADAELIELAKRCLAPAQNVRPRDASEMADAVSGYLTSVEERARKAELSAVAERTKAVEERRRRKLTLALAATVLVAALGAGGTFWWMDVKARERTRTANSAAAEAMQRAAALRGEHDWAPAIQEAEAAVRLAGTGGADAETVARAEELAAVIRADADRAEREAAREEERAAMVLRVSEIRSRRTTVFPYEERVADLVTALREFGIDLDALPPEEAGRRIRESGIEAEIVGALDYLNTWAPDDRLTAALPHADRDPWRNRVRMRHAAGDLETLVALARNPDLKEQPARSILLLAECVVSDRNSSFLAYRTAEDVDPDDFWVSYGFGYRLFSAARPDLALPRLLRATDLRPELNQPLNYLGGSYSNRGDFAPAARILRRLYERDPDYGDVGRNLAIILGNLGVQAAKGGSNVLAVAYYEEALTLSPENEDLLWALGHQYSKMHRHSDARDTLEKLLREFPDSQHAHGATVRLTEAHLGLWDVDAAVEVLERALELELRSDIGTLAYRALGTARTIQGRTDEARAAYEKSLALMRGNADSAWRLAELALIERDVGRALEAAERLGKIRGVRQASPLLSSAKALRLRVLRLAGRSQEAEELVDGWVEEAISMLSRPSSSAQLMYFGHLLGRQLLLRGDRLDEGALRERIEPVLHAPSGISTRGAKLDVKATADRRLGLVLFGMAAQLLPYLPERELLELVDRGYRLIPDHWQAGAEKARILISMARYEEAEDVLTDLLERNPGDKAATHRMGRVHLRRGRFEDAIPHLRRAFELCVTKCATCRRDLRAGERGAALAPRLDDLLAGRWEPEDPADLYLAAEACGYLGREEDALGLFSRARDRGPPPKAANPDLPREEEIYFGGRELRTALALAAKSSGEKAAHARRRALTSLRTHLEIIRELTLLPSQTTHASPGAGHLALLLTERTFAPVRDEERLAELPEDEAAEWRAFWEEVRELWKWVRP